jgi:undecaprenyl-diphosphatase
MFSISFFIEIIKIIILGIVEGITEWLPISSTGHMILIENFIKLNQSEAFRNTFLIIVQLGAILAVLTLYFNKLNPYDFKTKQFKQPILKLWSKVLVASIPAGIVGLAFDELIDSYLFSPIVVSIMLVVYGLAFIVIERRKKPALVHDFDQLSYKQALQIGMFQMLAMIPGTSRSGATILGGLLMKIKRSVIAEFSFFMAIPVMFGASLLKLIKVGLYFDTSEWALLIIGTVTAYIVSFFSIKFFIGYIKKHDFRIFGLYRIVLGLVVLLWFVLTLGQLQQ